MFENIQNYNFLINLLLHSLILFTFLTLFFIFFISKVSKKAFNNEIGHQIDNALNKVVPKLKENKMFNLIKDNINIKSLLDRYKDADKKVQKKNNSLIKNLVIVNIVLWICFILFVRHITSIRNDIDLLTIIGENLIVFSFVGIAEYYFFTRIALKFIPVEPSFISKQFLEELKSQFKSKSESKPESE